MLASSALRRRHLQNAIHEFTLKASDNNTVANLHLGAGTLEPASVMHKEVNLAVQQLVVDGHNKLGWGLTLLRNTRAAVLLNTGAHLDYMRCL